jgi:hypothetical protein
MKKNIVAAIALLLLLSSCFNVSPEKNFGIAALSSNVLYGFTGPGLHRQFASPSEKMVYEKTYATAPMSRAEVLQSKLDVVEDFYSKIKALSINEDSKAMITASLALYEFVLPVYKNEYRQLAALYDSNAPADSIAAFEKSLSDKYETEFEKLHRQLLEAGKTYAARHNIAVQEVNPSPAGH